MSIVYLIANKITGKSYVGCTRRSADKRWQEHCAAARSCATSSPLHSDIREMGYAAFEMVVLHKCTNYDAAQQLEIEEIEKRSTLAPQGYNLSPGGWLLTQEHREKIGRANSGPLNYGYGLKHSPERKARIAASLKGIKRSEAFRAEVSARMRATKAKLTPQQAAEIRERRTAGELCAPLAEHYGVSESLIAKIGRGIAWRDATA